MPRNIDVVGDRLDSYPDETPVESGEFSGDLVWEPHGIPTTHIQQIHGVWNFDQDLTWKQQRINQVEVAFGYQPTDDEDRLPCWVHSYRYRRVASPEGVIIERVWAALLELREAIEFHPDKLSGIPILKGSRFTIAQLLAELADGRSTVEIADAFTLDLHVVELCLHGLSAYLNRPMLR